MYIFTVFCQVVSFSEIRRAKVRLPPRKRGGFRRGAAGHVGGR